MRAGLIREIETVRKVYRQTLKPGLIPGRRGGRLTFRLDRHFFPRAYHQPAHGKLSKGERSKLAELAADLLQ